MEVLPDKSRWMTVFYRPYGALTDQQEVPFLRVWQPGTAGITHTSRISA